MKYLFKNSIKEEVVPYITGQINKNRLMKRNLKQSDNIKGIVDKITEA